jgi:hypothetical protein
MTFLIGAAILFVVAFIGFKVLRFVASIVIRLVLFLVLLAVAAYFILRYIV